MKFIKIHFENKKRFFLLNIDHIRYIDVHEENLQINRQPYAEVYFSDELAAIVLDAQQYQQLIDAID